LQTKRLEYFGSIKVLKKILELGKIKGTSLKSLFNINTPDEKILFGPAKSFVMCRSQIKIKTS
jgi:hypothetical protein